MMTGLEFTIFDVVCAIERTNELSSQHNNGNAYQMANKQLTKNWEMLKLEIESGMDLSEHKVLTMFLVKSTSQVCPGTSGK